MARRWEWEQQVLLASLLAKWIDPATTFATAVETVARDATSGAMRRKRGVVAGVPDNLVVHCGKLIGLELKSPQGKCSAAQRATRAALLRARIHAWWECRSANAAMWALAKSGVKFRVIVREDGTVEHWKKPRLADWEVPRRDPREARPWHPEVRAARRAARQRWRERQKAARVIEPHDVSVRAADLTRRT